MSDLLEYAHPIFVLVGFSFFFLDSLIWFSDGYFFKLPFLQRLLHYLLYITADILVICCLIAIYIVGTLNGVYIGLTS